MANDNTKQEVGSMPCLDEGCESHEINRNVIVYQNSKGTLSFTCDKCRISVYAPTTIKAHKNWLKRMGIAEPVAAAVVVPPLVKSGAFDMGAL